jgi:hypothetical protein
VYYGSCNLLSLDMRHLPVWVIEFFKLLGGRRLHPLTTQCPICRQVVRLHVNKAGRRHVFGHARSLYEGSRFSTHYATDMKCVASGSPKRFDPHPSERQHFKLPGGLLEE